MKKIKQIFQEFLSDWRAKTPKIAKFFRNLAGTVTGIVVVLSGIAGILPSLDVPIWFTNYGWYIAGICALITAYSGSQKVKSEIPINPQQ